MTFLKLFIALSFCVANSVFAQSEVGRPRVNQSLSGAADATRVSQIPGQGQCFPQIQSWVDQNRNAFEIGEIVNNQLQSIKSTAGSVFGFTPELNYNSAGDCDRRFPVQNSSVMNVRDRHSALWSPELSPDLHAAVRRCQGTNPQQERDVIDRFYASHIQIEEYSQAIIEQLASVDALIPSEEPILLGRPCAQFSPYPQLRSKCENLARCPRHSEESKKKFFEEGVAEYEVYRQVEQKLSELRTAFAGASIAVSRAESRGAIERTTRVQFALQAEIRQAEELKAQFLAQHPHFSGAQFKRVMERDFRADLSSEQKLALFERAFNAQNQENRRLLNLELMRMESLRACLTNSASTAPGCEDRDKINRDLLKTSQRVDWQNKLRSQRRPDRDLQSGLQRQMCLVENTVDRQGVQETAGEIATEVGIFVALTVTTGVGGVLSAGGRGSAVLASRLSRVASAVEVGGSAYYTSQAVQVAAESCGQERAALQAEMARMNQNQVCPSIENPTVQAVNELDNCVLDSMLAGAEALGFGAAVKVARNVRQGSRVVTAPAPTTPAPPTPVTARVEPAAPAGTAAPPAPVVREASETSFEQVRGNVPRIQSSRTVEGQELRQQLGSQNSERIEFVTGTDGKEYVAKTVANPDKALAEARMYQILSEETDNVVRYVGADRTPGGVRLFTERVDEMAVVRFDNEIYGARNLSLDQLDEIEGTINRLLDRNIRVTDAQVIVDTAGEYKFFDPGDFRMGQNPADIASRREFYRQQFVDRKVLLLYDELSGSGQRQLARNLERGYKDLNPAQQAEVIRRIREANPQQRAVMQNQTLQQILGSGAPPRANRSPRLSQTDLNTNAGLEPEEKARALGLSDPKQIEAIRRVESGSLGSVEVSNKSLAQRRLQDQIKLSQKRDILREAGVPPEVIRRGMREGYFGAPQAASRSTSSTAAKATPQISQSALIDSFNQEVTSSAPTFRVQLSDGRQVQGQLIARSEDNSTLRFKVPGQKDPVEIPTSTVQSAERVVTARTDILNPEAPIREIELALPARPQARLDQNGFLPEGEVLYGKVQARATDDRELIEVTGYMRTVQTPDGRAVRVMDKDGNILNEFSESDFRVERVDELTPDVRFSEVRGSAGNVEFEHQALERIPRGTPIEVGSKGGRVDGRFLGTSKSEDGSEYLLIESSGGVQTIKANHAQSIRTITPATPRRSQIIGRARPPLKEIQRNAKYSPSQKAEQLEAVLGRPAGSLKNNSAFVSELERIETQSPTQLLKLRDAQGRQIFTREEIQRGMDHGLLGAPGSNLDEVIGRSSGELGAISRNIDSDDVVRSIPPRKAQSRRVSSENDLRLRRKFSAIQDFEDQVPYDSFRAQNLRIAPNKQTITYTPEGKPIVDMTFIDEKGSPQVIMRLPEDGVPTISYLQDGKAVKKILTPGLLARVNKNLMRNPNAVAGAKEARADLRALNNASVRRFSQGLQEQGVPHRIVGESGDLQGVEVVVGKDLITEFQKKYRYEGANPFRIEYNPVLASEQRALGFFDSGGRRIVVSRPDSFFNTDEVEYTLLHEITHAKNSVNVKRGRPSPYYGELISLDPATSKVGEATGYESYMSVDEIETLYKMERQSESQSRMRLIENGPQGSPSEPRKGLDLNPVKSDKIEPVLRATSQNLEATRNVMRSENFRISPQISDRVAIENSFRNGGKEVMVDLANGVYYANVPLGDSSYRVPLLGFTDKDMSVFNSAPLGNFPDSVKLRYEQRRQELAERIKDRVRQQVDSTEQRIGVHRAARETELRRVRALEILNGGSLAPGEGLGFIPRGGGSPVFVKNVVIEKNGNVTALVNQGNGRFEPRRLSEVEFKDLQVLPGGR